MERLAKQRKREKAYREKRKAKKIAENGGEIIKMKICPHCGKEFTPTSNRQVFPEVAKLFTEKVKQLFSFKEAQERAEKEAREKERQERIKARRNKRGMER